MIAAAQGRLGESALRQMSPGERLATGLSRIARRMCGDRPAKRLAESLHRWRSSGAAALRRSKRSIFTRINEIWHDKANPDSIILYGHRRMGKSSILRNLNQAAPGRVIAYVNLQGETSLSIRQRILFLALADRIYAEVKSGAASSSVDQPPHMINSTRPPPHKFS